MEKQAATVEARFHPLQQILYHFLQNLLEAVKQESTLELIMTGMQALKQCLENACRLDWSPEAAPSVAVAGSESASKLMLKRRSPLKPSTSHPLLNADIMAQIAKRIMICFNESIQRRAVRSAEAQTDEDYDEEEEERDAMMGAEEEELQFNLSEVLGSIFKTHGEAFIPVFSELWMEKIVQLSQPQCIATDRKFAAYVICDLLEYCGEGAAPLLYALKSPRWVRSNCSSWCTSDAWSR